MMHPINDFDETKSAFIEPHFVIKHQENFPERFVSTFSNPLITLNNLC